MTSLVQVRVLELFRGLLVISVLQVRPDSSLELLDDLKYPNVLPEKPKRLFVNFPIQSYGILPQN